MLRAAHGSYARAGLGARQLPRGLGVVVARRMARRAPAFTLVELVVIIALVGVLAVVALARFADRLGFDTLGFADQTRAAIELARKSAIAQRRKVCMSFAANTVTATQASAPGSTAACNMAFTDPATGQALSHPAPAGVSLAASGALDFDALGEPLGASANITVTISGDAARTLTVERSTGHVH